MCEAAGLIVFTHDLDFGALLALTQQAKPSVAEIRTKESYEKGRTDPPGLIGNRKQRLSSRQQRPQMPEDQHSPGYSNDVAHSWLTGLNEDGMKPSFDRGNSWRQGRNPKLRKD